MLQNAGSDQGLQCLLSESFYENFDKNEKYNLTTLLSADLFKKGCCQLQAKVCARISG